MLTEVGIKGSAQQNHKVGEKEAAATNRDEASVAGHPGLAPLCFTAVYSLFSMSFTYSIEHKVLSELSLWTPTECLFRNTLKMSMGCCVLLCLKKLFLILIRIDMNKLREKGGGGGWAAKKQLITKNHSDHEVVCSILVPESRTCLGKRSAD